MITWECDVQALEHRPTPDHHFNYSFIIEFSAKHDLHLNRVNRGWWVRWDSRLVSGYRANLSITRQRSDRQKPCLDVGGTVCVSLHMETQLCSV